MTLEAADLSMLQSHLRAAVTEVKGDFVREVMGIKGDMLGRFSTLNTQMLAEFKIVSDRLGNHKRDIDTEIARIRLVLETEQVRNAKSFATLETKPCSDVALHVATEHQREKRTGWSVLRDVAMIVTMLGVAYGLLKENFLTARDLIPKAPVVSVGK
jgi:hypothetical protein